MKRTYYPRKRDYKVRPARELVAKVLDGHNLNDEVRATRLRQNWDRIVGARLAARTRPTDLRQGVLHLHVWDSSWMHHLSFLRDDLITSINQRMGDPPMVTELRMRIGRVFPPRKPTTSSQMASEQNTRAWRSVPPPVSDERAAEIAADTACVEDDELRQIIIDLRCRWDK